MNDQINKLKEQAKEKVISHGAYGETEIYWEINVDKFAELIVRECMTTMLKESKWYWDKDEWESSSAIQSATRRVKEHFGVEE